MEKLEDKREMSLNFHLEISSAGLIRWWGRMKMSLRTARSQHFIFHAYLLRDYWKTPYSATRRKPRKKTWKGTRKGEPNKGQEQLSQNDADVVDQEDNPLMGLPL